MHTSSTNPPLVAIYHHQRTERGFLYPCIVELYSDRVRVGSCAIHSGNQIGIALHPPFQGRGLGYKIAKKLIDRCGLPVLVWWCYEENIASNRLAKKLGFVLVREDRGVNWYELRRSS